MMGSRGISKRENALARFFTLVRKELAIIWSDKQALAIVMILPALAVVAIGATSISSTNSVDLLTAGRAVNIGVVNEDTSLGNPNPVPLSVDYINILGNLSDVTLTMYNNTSEANQSVWYEHTIGFIVIGEGFETNITTGLPTYITFYSDALYVLAEPLIANKVNDAITIFKQQYGYNANDITYNTANLFQVNSALFVNLPLILTLTLCASGLMLGCQSVVGDNPLYRVALSPATKFELITSKVTAYTALHMVSALLLLGIPLLGFHMYYRGDFFIIWMLCALPAFCGVSLGVFFSTLCKTKLQGSQAFLVGFMAIFILGSGLFLQGNWPIIFPMVHNQAVFNIIAYKGLGIVQAWPQIWPQLVFGGVFYVAALIMLYLKKEAV
jgi:ABC-2 type transport system permease protein